jgi:hypothetical protein
MYMYEHYSKWCGGGVSGRQLFLFMFSMNGHNLNFSELLRPYIRTFVILNCDIMYMYKIISYRELNSTDRLIMQAMVIPSSYWLHFFFFSCLEYVFVDFWCHSIALNLFFTTENFAKKKFNNFLFWHRKWPFEI